MSVWQLCGKVFKAGVVILYSGRSQMPCKKCDCTKSTTLQGSPRDSLGKTLERDAKQASLGGADMRVPKLSDNSRLQNHER